MSDFAWFCLMIMVAMAVVSAPEMIREWRKRDDDSE